MRWKLAAFIVVILALASAGFGWNYYTNTPQYALGEIAAAVEARDYTAFQQRVDVDAVIERVVSDLMDAVMAEAAREMERGDGMAAFGAAMGGALIEGMRPMVTSMMKEAVREGVTSGDIGGALASTDSTADGPQVAELANHASFADGFRGVGKVEKRGDYALVSLNFHEADFDTTLALQLRMTRPEGAWKLVAIENLRDYMDALDALQNERLAELNTQREAEMASHVSIGELATSVRSYGLFDTRMNIEVPVTNVGDKPLSTVLVFLDGPNGRLDQEYWLSLGQLRPGESGVATKQVRYNAYIDEHDLIRSGGVTPTIGAVVVFEDGDHRRIFRYNSWDHYQNNR